MPKWRKKCKKFPEKLKKTITETISKKKISYHHHHHATVNSEHQFSNKKSKSNFPFDKQNDYKMIRMNFFFWTKKKQNIHPFKWIIWVNGKKRNKMELKVERKKNHFIFNRSIIWTLSSSSIIIHSFIQTILWKRNFHLTHANHKREKKQFFLMNETLNLKNNNKEQHHHQMWEQR